jgi:hypothetical protein
MINLERVVESDTDKCGNYITLQYEFPFPEESVLQARRDEEMRYQLNKPIITMRSDSNNCQKGE